MDAVLLAVIIFLCGVVWLQDFHQRAVLWFLFPSLALCGTLFHFRSHSLSELMTALGVNLCIILLQFVVLFLFFFLKEGNIDIIKKKIGPGDILFIINCAFFFTPLNFLVFYVCSLCFSLLLHFVFAKHGAYTKHGASIALAGWQALFLGVALPSASLWHVDIFSDNLILQCMYGNY